MDKPQSDADTHTPFPDKGSASSPLTCPSHVTIVCLDSRARWGDDPFFSEISNFIDTVENVEKKNEPPQILSTYEDSVRTYKFTWAIRKATEKSSFFNRQDPTIPIPSSETRPLLRRPSIAAELAPSIDRSRLILMDKAAPVPGNDDFNLLFIGAGNIMFGSDEGPWNHSHSFRLEHKLDPCLKVVVLVDPSIERASAVLQQKRDSFVVSAYKDNRVFKTFKDFIENMSAANRPSAVKIGSPPMFRGSTQPGRDIELQILKHIPGVAIFMKIPIATGIENEINGCF